MPSVSENLLEFFQLIWKDTKGLVYIPYLTKEVNEATGKRDMKGQFAKWPDQATAIVENVLKNSALGHEQYFSPVFYSRPKAEKQYVVGSHVLWVDLDGNADSVTWTDDPSASPGHLAPSLRVQSSTPDRQHAYWFLDEPITDVKVLENKTRTLAYSIGGDTGGWDANQLLRPPYTTNHGYAKPERQGRTHDVFIEEASNRTYPADKFGSSDDFRTVVRESLGEIPAVSKVLALHQLSQEFYDDFTRPVQEGRRSDALMSVAYQAAEIGMSDEEIYSLVDDMATRAGKYEGRTDRDRRLTDIVERAKTKHPQALVSIFANLIPPDDKPLQDVFGFMDFMALDIHIEWFLDNLMARGDLGIIYGGPGVGKTQFGIRLSMAICEGKKFLEWDVTDHKNHKVLFWSLEMGAATLKHLMGTIQKDLTDAQKLVYQEYLQIFPAGEGIPINRPEGKAFLETHVQKYNPEILFVDSFGKITDGSLSDDESVRKLMDYLSSLRKKYGISVYVVHHDRKQQDRKNKSDQLDDAYGSRYISSDTDWMINLTAMDNEGSVIKVAPVKTRNGPQQQQFLIQRTSSLNFEYVDEVADDSNNSNSGKRSKGASPAVGGFFTGFGS